MKLPIRMTDQNSCKSVICSLGLIASKYSRISSHSLLESKLHTIYAGSESKSQREMGSEVFWKQLIPVGCFYFEERKTNHPSHMVSLTWAKLLCSGTEKLHRIPNFDGVNFGLSIRCVLLCRRRSLAFHHHEGFKD